MGWGATWYKLQLRGIHITVGPSRECYRNTKKTPNSRWESRKSTSAKCCPGRGQSLGRENMVPIGTCHTGDNRREATESQLKRGCVWTHCPVEELGTLHWQPCKSLTLESSLQQQTT